jgi:hypothetical protein
MRIGLGLSGAFAGLGVVGRGAIVVVVVGGVPLVAATVVVEKCGSGVGLEHSWARFLSALQVEVLGSNTLPSVQPVTLVLNTFLLRMEYIYINNV